MANQFLRPVSDDLSGADPWPNDPWWSKVDEISASDADYAESVPGAGSSQMAVYVQTTPVFDPTIHTGHILRVRAWQPSGTPNSGEIILSQDGVGTIATFPTSGNWPASATTITNTLSSGEAALITDYSLLRVTVFTFGGTVRVSWIEFEIPEAAPIEAAVSDVSVFTMTPQTANTVQPDADDESVFSMLVPGLNDPERLIDAGRMFRVKRTLFSPGSRSALIDFEDL